MNIRIDDPTLLIELRDHLRHAGFIAFELGPDALQVTVPDASSASQERRELDAHLATWTAAKDVSVEVRDT